MMADFRIDVIFPRNTFSGSHRYPLQNLSVSRQSGQMRIRIVSPCAVAIAKLVVMSGSRYTRQLPAYVQASKTSGIYIVLEQHEENKIEPIHV